ncbi:XamI family restriction endonuclease [Nesterenkonia ebinurensis]|uniref:XamI family restriction endonuclease n=1 Tax=Nesterenkonia ebinurensis TaxID=2608252 RepID=UPI00168B8E15|nr:XamI family restriction endonuclease [Nesterenkonia ebinurensis]
MSETLRDRGLLTALRYLTAPPISQDDLELLAKLKLTAQWFTTDTRAVDRALRVIRLGIDPYRFPWLRRGDVPTEEERESAVLSTAALMASQRIQTDRRNYAKDEQEEAVAAMLRSLGYTEIPRRPMTNTLHFPGPGEFCSETDFGGGRADLVIRLRDGSIMPVECKVSNSYTNSVKRLNREAAAKAEAWIRRFGTSTIPSAVLSGAFKVDNLLAAQEQGLTLFWAHNLHALATFIESADPA